MKRFYLRMREKKTSYILYIFFKEILHVKMDTRPRGEQRRGFYLRFYDSCICSVHTRWMWWVDHDSAPGGVGPRPVITQRGDKPFSVFIVGVTSRYVRGGFYGTLAPNGQKLRGS